VKSPDNPKILAKNSKIGTNTKIAEDVTIECNDLTIGDNVSIGIRTQENFRSVAGVVIKVEKLVLEDGVTIGRQVSIKGGTIHLAQNTTIKSNNTINVVDKLEIGKHGTINEHCEISGRDITIGQELWMLPYVKIGGGSAFEVHSKLCIGHYCHIGMYCFINTARPVYIGDEVGLGTRTMLYTHGAYSSVLKGFPVAFGEIHVGSYTWIPGAVVTPGIRIGKNCVIGVNSLVNKDIPDGAFAAGSPAKIIKQNAFPREFTPEQRADFFRGFLQTFAQICSDKFDQECIAGSDVINFGGDNTTILFKEQLGSQDLNDDQNRRLLIVYTNDVLADNVGNLDKNVTIFDLKKKYIYGFPDDLSELLANQLRRYGARFYSRPQGQVYVKWA
jgi:acetyltransferase-like isoleucine patch superfamily enzyme